MALEEMLRDPQFTADFPHFVLVEGGKGLDKSVSFDQGLDSRNAIVVCLNQIRFGRSARFDRIRIDRALAKNPVAIQKIAGFQDSILDLYKLLTNSAPFLLRLMKTGQYGEEFGLGVFGAKVLRSEFAEDFFDELCLLQPHQSGINV